MVFGSQAEDQLETDKNTCGLDCSVEGWMDDKATLDSNKNYK